MKKHWILGFAAITFAAFTACNSENDATTEAETIETTEDIEADLETDMNEDTVMLQDTPVEDGVADEIQEEQPPVQ